MQLNFPVFPEDWICLMMDIRIFEGPEIDGARLRPLLLE
jgi:hypothetical protein